LKGVGREYQFMTRASIYRKPLKGKRILVVEDNPTNQFVMRQLLQAAGSFSSTTVWQANVQVLPFPDARISPFFSLGTGWLRNEPKSTLVDAEEVSEWAGNAALGVRGWLTRRFLVRADLRHHVFTRDVNNNDDFTEMSLGFSVFF